MLARAVTRARVATATSRWSARCVGLSQGNARMMSLSTARPPIISLDDGSDDAVAQLAEAFAEYGCCYLSGTGVSRALEKRVMESAKAFCALPEDVKSSIPVVQNGQGFTRGYIGMGKESGSEDRIEVKEAFSYGYEWPSDSAFDQANGLQGPNVWPSDRVWPAQHREAMNEFFTRMARASRSVSRQLSQTLYGDAKFLDGFCNHGDTISIMRLFHYFPYSHFGAPPPCGFEFIGSSPHTDWGFLTLILQDEVGGLQVLHKDKWIDVPYVPDTLVVNAGDYLSLITNGKCVSPVHRVIADDRERYSMVFFYYPDFDAVIPSVNEELTARIGGNRGAASTDAFNNLLDGTVKKVDGCFGEYIMAKWAGVQR
ncbi:hypothetical protein Poli38472_008396 [Pythium oligandrum]|uniref:Fe2OG dioxygenase domain-containing protein n=1 Tax=Pythium oligandrum TaxID=41045 RepID=A0A8K1CLJ9_PYTOL|nr:hypothetical protein Poli38472_008396 [Pythium oligandrum]|eukprot:TMW65754.1 hypothetical protein Poli38472_008396 [Pythium oligandrum]